MKKRTFPSQFEQIREIGRFVLEGAVRAGFDERGAYHIELAVDEACTNVVEHAHAGRDDGSIDVTWQINDSSFHIIIEDDGQPFDPSLVEIVLPSAETKAQNVATGGLGMHFMRTLMDEVRYEREQTKNRVTLMKWLPTDESIVVNEMLDGLPIVRVAGRIDTMLTDALEAALGGLVAADTPKIVIDLSETTYGRWRFQRS